MSRVHLIKVVRVSLHTLFIAAALATLSPDRACAQSCIENAGPPLMDTSHNPAASPSNPRATGADFFQWAGEQFLVYNNGNEVVLHNFDSPTNPGPPISSAFLTVNGGFVPPYGDTDYNLFGISLCDDCRWAVASYLYSGAVIFDMGIDDTPGFPASQYYASTSVKGAFTFQHQGQQYLVMNDLPDGCNSATLYTIDGINQEDRQQLQCLWGPNDSPLRIDGGFYLDHGPQPSVYLVTSTGQVQMYQVVGAGNSLNLVDHGSVMQGTISKHKGIRIDYDAKLAISAGLWGARIWDLEDPLNPVLLSSWNPNPSLTESIAAVDYPLAFIGVVGAIGDGSTFLYDISSPTNPVIVEPNFWSASHPWNDIDASFNRDAAFADESPWLVFARNSVLQKFDVNECLEPDPPSASIHVGPVPAFPGDLVTVTNTTYGEFSTSAIWVENENGFIVLGSGSMSSNEPISRQFQLAIDLDAGSSYQAFVAIANLDFPCDNPIENPGPCGDQITSSTITIDRTPETTIFITPSSPITGDTVILDGSGTQGYPSSFEWQVKLDGGVPPGHPPAGFDPADPTTHYPLSHSGQWAFTLTAGFLHEASPPPGLWQSIDHESISIGSVSADFEILPASPVNTEQITLCSTSRFQPGTTPEYDWEISTGAATVWSSDDCGPSPGCATCGVVLPPETLAPGTYDVTLLLVDPANGDSSNASAQMVVADGWVNLDFSWTPQNPNIGETMVLSIEGVTSVEQATWQLGGPGCPGYDELSNCIPGPYTDCMNHAYRYSTSGPKSVRLSVVSEGQILPSVIHVVSVNNLGSCAGGSESHIFSNGFESGDSSGWTTTRD